MVFISMSLDLSLSECIHLYLFFLHHLKPSLLLKALSIKGHLVKNGKRYKKYINRGNEYKIVIQRMTYNNNYYFDLFPLFLIPNSTSLMMDYLIFDNKYRLVKRRNDTKFDKLNREIDLFNKNEFEIVYQSKSFLIYKSNKKYLIDFRKGRLKNKSIKKDIYIVYLLQSAHNTFL